MKTLLDLFCKAGGASMGYHLAGVTVVGVDLEPQPNYPFEFIQADAMTVDLSGFDAIHASPPCQGYATVTEVNGARGNHPRLIGPVRERLEATGRPYIIENVESAKSEMVNWVRLCGSSFGLNVRRHRLFECGRWYPLMVPPCSHHWQTRRFQNPDGRRGHLLPVVGVQGHTNYVGESLLRQQAMGIDWMSPKELTQAIPPAYTQWLGQALLQMAQV